MQDRLLDRRDTDFVRDNMLINYCLGDNDELLIDSFIRNNRVDIRFRPQQFYLIITGIHRKFIPQYTCETFSNGVSIALEVYKLIDDIFDDCGYTGNAFLIKEDNSKQLGVLFSPGEHPACTPEVLAEKIDALYRRKTLRDPQYVSTSLVGPYFGYSQGHQAFIDARELNDLLFFGLKNCIITKELRRATARLCDVTAILSNVRALVHTVCRGTLSKALTQANYLVDSLVAPSFSMANYHALYAAIDDLLVMLETVYPQCVHIDRSSAREFYTLDAYKRYLQDTLRVIFTQLSSVHCYPPSILLALSFIHRNYVRQFSLSELSEYVYSNASSLSSEFNAEVGATLSEYVGELRLAHARRLLEQTTLSISEIARQSGFGSAKYFREIFKKKTGVLPQQYRESIRE